MLSAWKKRKQDKGVENGGGGGSLRRAAGEMTCEKRLEGNERTSHGSSFQAAGIVPTKPLGEIDLKESVCPRR